MSAVQAPSTPRIVSTATPAAPKKSMRRVSIDITIPAPTCKFEVEGSDDDSISTQSAPASLPSPTSDIFGHSPDASDNSVSTQPHVRTMADRRAMFKASQHIYPQTAKIFVGNLDNTMSQAQLAEAIEHIFRQNGVRGAFVNLKNKTNAFGTVTPYAFVQFKRLSQAAHGREALDSAMIGGLRVRVTWAEQRSVLAVPCDGYAPYHHQIVEKMVEAFGRAASARPAYRVGYGGPVGVKVHFRTHNSEKSAVKAGAVVVGGRLHLLGYY